MTDAQFQALAQLLRLRTGPAREAASLHLVQGLTVPDAARAVGMDYRAATYSVKRVKEGLALAKAAAGLCNHV
jgi:hypothetical protein